MSKCCSGGCDCIVVHGDSISVTGLGTIAEPYTVTYDPPKWATADRPDATSVAVGYQGYDTTLGIPIWSDGAVWTDATGATV